MAVHVLIVFLIIAAGDAIHPVLMLEIPFDCLLDAFCEAGLGIPAHLSLDLVRCDSVTAVMALTVLHILAPVIIGEERKIYKGVSANVDFYSGFVYSMLDLPPELFTPMFAVARVAGWSAHRIEELANNGKIIRPAYKSVAKRQPYVPLTDR